MSLLPRSLPRRLATDGYVGDIEEGQSGVLQMRVLSAPKLARYTPVVDEVLITISTPGRRTAPQRAGWIEVLALVFDDTGSLAASRPDARSICIEDARRIVAFVSRHVRRRRLVLSCDAGISRSRSVAAAVARLLNLPYRWTVLNPVVYDLLSHVGEESDLPASPTHDPPRG
ncbi:MAG: hypothetical protein IBJ19_00790 [Gemmatimonadaceae bacterium]|nr:hypothetical protein [Gemmatimonadaceae bacterium]